MRFILLCVFLVVFSFTSAQDTVKTAVSASKVVSRFTNNSETVSWAIPVSKTEAITLNWTERKNSFTVKEGIRTFVGYHNTAFIATLSIQKETVSADISYNAEELTITTSQDGFLAIVRTQEKNICGSCCNDEKHSHEEYSFESKKVENKNNDGINVPGVSRSVLPGTVYNNAFGRTFDKYIHKAMANAVVADSDKSDGSDVLRIYRLALPVAYNAFDRSFSRNVDKVKEFWAKSETYLNELYMRDIGVKFQVINDEKLISVDKETDPVEKDNDGTTVVRSTQKFVKDRIGDEYDLGVFIVILKEAAGLANLFSAYSKSARANAASGPALPLVAHEIGHMFGAYHTFTTGGVQTHNVSEPGRGSSVMSYGAPRDFFNLVSVQEILEKLNTSSYYSDKERKMEVYVSGSSSNIPFGIKSNNQPPLLDRTKLKREYVIPKHTFFQFNIQATDPDGDKLLYAVHQADKNGKPAAQFCAFAPTEDNNVTFQSKYFLQKRFNLIFEIPYSAPEVTGTYSFLVGASDGGNKSETHRVLYDMQKVIVKILDGTPFKITSPKMQGEYKSGEKIRLEWAVDKAIFSEGSKVRILLSDDFGKTFKYVLKDNAPNNGSCEVILPNISIGQVKIKDNIDAGVIKVEVIDELAYALTEVNPENNGFRLVMNAALPIVLLDGSFKGQPVDNNIELTWKTGVESATSGFAVERSANGLDFETIGNIASKGSNSTYLFTDKKPLSGNNYYRLAFLQIEGGVVAQRSHVINVDAGAAGSIKLYPNPVASTLNIEAEERGTAVIYNTAGAALQHLSLHKGKNTVNISTLPAGVYILKTKTESVKFVKQ